MTYFFQTEELFSSENQNWKEWIWALAKTKMKWFVQKNLASLERYFKIISFIRICFFKIDSVNKNFFQLKCISFMKTKLNLN